jgi:hypothetical protein
MDRTNQRLTRISESWSPHRVRAMPSWDSVCCRKAPKPTRVMRARRLSWGCTTSSTRSSACRSIVVYLACSRTQSGTSYTTSPAARILLGVAVNASTPATPRPGSPRSLLLLRTASPSSPVHWIILAIVASLVSRDQYAITAKMGRAENEGCVSGQVAARVYGQDQRPTTVGRRYRARPQADLRKAVRSNGTLSRGGQRSFPADLRTRNARSVTHSLGPRLPQSTTSTLDPPLPGGFHQ